MRPRRFAALAGPALGLGLLATAPAVPAQTGQSPRHLAAALELLREVRPGDSSYRHKDPEVSWPGEGGANQAVCHTDCSGLLNALIARGYPDLGTLENFKKWFGERRPRAEDYHDAIQARKGFRGLGHVADVHPGDVIAIRYPPGAGETGHAMLVAEAPRRREPSKPLVEGTVQWEVAVIDQSRTGHGPADTRHNPDGTFRGGLGRGVFRLYVHRDGTVAGHSWSTVAASEYYEQAKRHLVIGRLDPTYRP